jgi:chorismate synthase
MNKIRYNQIIFFGVKMAGNTFGSAFTVTTFGESHGNALGCVIDGCPAGIKITAEDIQTDLDKRKPGNVINGKLNPSTTSRSEDDKVEILSGIFNGTTEGTPIALLIHNTSQHSSDYSNIEKTYRPGHADFTYDQKYGFRDFRGGGRSSGRETVSRVAAGAIAKKILSKMNIKITAYTLRAAGIQCKKIDFSEIDQNFLRAPDNDAAKLMQNKIEEVRKSGDSTGGIIECVIKNVPSGIGEPVFDKLDAQLAKAMLSVGAIKGIEFGNGFNSVDSLGSQNNDEMDLKDGKPHFKTNNAGGILGGISNGNDIVFRLAVKPVPSIFKSQQTIKSLENGKFEETELLIQGRHDVCLCPRIVPVVEAMSALTILDLLLIGNKNA